MCNVMLYIIYLLNYRYSQTSLYKNRGIGKFTILNLRTIHPLDDGLKQRNIALRVIHP